MSRDRVARMLSSRRFIRVRTWSSCHSDGRLVREQVAPQYSKEAWLGRSRGKLSPFCGRSDGFQWLTMEGEIDLLISWDGRW